MKRHLIKAVSVIVLIFIMGAITGCSNSSNKTSSEGSTVEQLAEVQSLQPPEPYTRAVEALNSKADLRLALTYLDLVIKDFPNDSEHVYKAHLLKSIIYCDYYKGDGYVMETALKGFQRAIRNIDDSDRDQLRNLAEYITATVNNPSSLNDCLVSIRYVISNYSNTTKAYTLPLTLPPEIASTLDQNRLSNFNNTGFPIPLVTEVDSVRYTTSQTFYRLDFAENPLNANKDSIIKSGSIDYPNLFQTMAIELGSREKDRATSKLLAQKVIEITEGDQYNKYRIYAQDALKSL